MRKNVSDYYRRKSVQFGVSGDRQGKILPLMSSLRNKKILDVGCASGYLGAYLKSLGNYVVGIDQTARDIKLAKKVLDEAHVFDLEVDNPRRFKRQFDFILFTEVIEHLFDPDSALEKIVSWLKPDGQILVTTVNFVHLYNRWNIVSGHFVYREETIINKSHVHFFTYETLRDLLGRVGLDIVRENHVILPRTLSFVWKICPSLFASQLVVLCQKVE